MGIATFAGIFDANNRYTYCGNKNFLNALKRGNKHTGVLWLSAFLSIELLILNTKKMETKFTKGEWIITTPTSKSDPQRIATTAIQENPNKVPYICDMWGMATDEGKANSKLISYAPEMFYRTVLLANSEGWQDAFDLIYKITGKEYKYLSDDFNRLVEEARSFFKH